MGRTVYKLAERLMPRMNGRSCNHFRTCGSLPSALRVFQQALTVESNSWTIPLVLRLPSSENVSARYCWNGSILVASFSHIVWSVTVDRSRESCYVVRRACVAVQRMCRPAFAQVSLLTRFLTAQASLLTRFLTLRAPDWNRADRFIIQLNG